MTIYLVMKSVSQPQYVNYNACMDYAEPYNEVHSAYYNKEDARRICDQLDASSVNKNVSDDDDEEQPETFYWTKSIEVQ